MLAPEGSRTTHNPDTVRRAGLFQRIGHSLGPILGFEGPHVNPNLDMGYSRREKNVGKFVVATTFGVLILLGINNAENRVQKHLDRIAAEHDTSESFDSDSNSGQ